MIRRTTWVAILLFVSSLFGVNAAWSADPFGSTGGSFDQGQSPYQGTMGSYPQGSGVPSPYPQMPGTQFPYAQPSFMSPFPQQGEGSFRESPSMEMTASPWLPPLLPERQSAFEQLVSGNVEITKVQFDIIQKDPNIKFSNTMAVPPPGSIVVAVKIVPLPEKKDPRQFQPMVQPTIQPPEIDAGYLTGPPERIGEIFRLLGIPSPYFISMDLKHFGFDLFLRGRESFLTTNRLPVGPDYVLGPGDEVKVRIWGKVEGAWSLAIARDGTVRMPKVGVITLGGLSFEQAKETLQKEFSRYFSGFEMNVTLGALRTMSVYVVGNARQPGAYTVSSLSTLVNVLFQAGGPTKSGSMRDIQIRRGGQVIGHFDMYDFLRRGDKSGDLRLLPEDVIFLPPIGPVAAIAGSVNSPGLYELKGERTVSQLIELAGGLNALAFRGRLQIERIVESNRQIVFESDLEESKEKEVDLRSGDILKVFQVVPDRRTVRVVGAVQRDGEYGFKPGMTVKDLLSLSGGTKYFAYLKEGELTRLHVTDAGPRVEKVNVDLEKAIAGDPASNLPLQENDQLFIRTIPEWRMYSQVTVLGEFRFPGTYTVRKGEKLSSLIERAGGFTEKAYPRGAVFTRESVRELQQKRLTESIDRLDRELISRGSTGLSAAASPEELKAKEGEIKQSKELIAKMKSVQASGRMVMEIAPPEVLKKTIYDIELENGDSLVVPENPRSLQTLGAVFNQTAFVFDQTKDLQEYIEMAGGYTESADKGRVFVLKVNGSAVRPKGGGLFLFSKATQRDGRPLLEPGDAIIVPEKLDRIAWMREFKDITQIIFQIAVSAGVLITLF
jgi:polysaccharide export outer membrane protein